jgi:hypothetical protein
MSDHILGYGSLFSAASRTHTGVSGTAIPIRLYGFDRTWCARFDGNQTALGVIRNRGATMNAVVVPVEDIQAFDRREVGYSRHPVRRGDIRLVCESDVLPDGDIWIYLPDMPEPCSETFPILASYLDVILSGLLTDPEYLPLGLELCQEFCRTTSGWGPILRDRASPRYPRAMPFVPLATQIDAVLAECLPNTARWVELRGGN